MITKYMIDQLKAQFDRLSISTDNNPYSGLTVREFVEGDEGELQGIVRVYDDYDSGLYYSESLLSILKDLEEADLDSSSVLNIWQQIAGAEFI